MEKRIISDTVSIDTFGGITFIDLSNKYSEKVAEIMCKYENVHDIRVTCESYEYNDGENIEKELIIHFMRNETDDEYDRRKCWEELHNKETQKRELIMLKELIDKYADVAKEYINESKK